LHPRIRRTFVAFPPLAARTLIECLRPRLISNEAFNARFGKHLEIGECTMYSGGTLAGLHVLTSTIVDQRCGNSPSELARRIVCVAYWCAQPTSLSLSFSFSVSLTRQKPARNTERTPGATSRSGPADRAVTPKISAVRGTNTRGGRGKERTGERVACARAREREEEERCVPSRAFSGAGLRRRALLASFTSPRAPEVSWKRSLFHLPCTGGKRGPGMDVLGVPEAHLCGYASRN